MPEMIRVLAIAPFYEKPIELHIENSIHAFRFMVNGDFCGVDFYDTQNKQETKIAIVSNEINLKTTNPDDYGYDLTEYLPDNIDFHGAFFFVGYENGSFEFSRESYQGNEGWEQFLQEEKEEFEGRQFRSLSDTEIKRILKFLGK